MPPGMPPPCCSPCPDRGFFTVSSTDSSRHVASEAAVIALALTMAGSLESRQVSRLTYQVFD